MAQITYDDKEPVLVNPLPDVNKFTAEDANEIKEVVNANAEILDELLNSGGEWTFADNGGNFPVTTRGGVIYVAIDSWGNNGDDGYIPPDTWFMSKTGGGSTRTDYRVNL